MSKKTIDKIVDAYEKTRPKREITVEPVYGFPIGFTTDDLSISMRGGKVNVTVKLILLILLLKYLKEYKLWNLLDQV